ncbi:diguanylate cyclase domain-containing protein [Fervidobacterium pennivorans]|uniref:sensor domain-containing diguanylate cyclase n=1 Tax=Fervidobacterium pennivorans TaxID=93466 RepID=UPI001436AA06|nr:diguanylate cyclase [Fervidobacterium pennivorans]QIV78607.1 sensor domain-containing diguanylate cyclase [Fervidobacterium pennivorans subsp. keratinolyticus]
MGFLRLANWKFLIFLLTIIISFIIGMNFFIYNEDENLKKLARIVIENEAVNISFAYFQWTELYEALKNNDSNFINNVKKIIRKDYPYVNYVEFSSGYPPTGYFEITSEGTLLLMRFKILDSFGNSYLPDKFAVVKLDASYILEKYQIKGIKISSGDRTLSKDFVYGLKYERFLTIKEIFLILLFLVLIVSITLFVNEFKTQKLLKMEETLNKSLEAITELTQGLLKGILAPSYQFILEKAVEIIPGAQAGSVLIKNGDYYEFAPCVGYDFAQLSKVKFKPEELAQSLDGQVKIITHLDEFDSTKIMDERQEILLKYGRISEIKAMLSVPISVENEIVAFLNLDNFEDEKAFNEFSIRIATVFANQVGVVFERIKLENELQKQKEYLEYISLRDPLTNLPNRRALENEAERMLALANREGKQVCVVYVDLKNFKPVNDRFGHKAGDYVISVVAQRLSSVMRKSDFLARVGGDEFVYLLYDCKEYVQIVERVINELEKPIQYEENTINVSANFDIAIYPKDATSFGDLLLKADVAMYYAKNNNLYFFLASNLNV